MLTTRDIQAAFGLGGPAGSWRGAKIDSVCRRRALPSMKGTTFGDRGTREKEDMELLLEERERDCLSVAALLRQGWPR
ncbi:hypothetical protein A7X12_00235 [Sphingomonas sp. TDK1]|nr:hypothetical protein A7X12_00235 [Sphingomonas sp. TDK1]